MFCLFYHSSVGEWGAEPVTIIVPGAVWQAGCFSGALRPQGLRIHAAKV